MWQFLCAVFRAQLHKVVQLIQLFSAIAVTLAMLVSRMGDRGRFRSFIFLLSLAGTGTATADISLRWQDGTAEADSLLADYLIKSNVVTDFVDLVQQNFAFDPALVLIVGAIEGPEYNADGRVLRLPYAFLGRAVETQAKLVEQGEVAIERALDVVEYTLYHLLGHALVSDSSIDADATAEALSTWIMLSNWPNGGEQWLNDLRAFGDASQKLDGPLSDIWHEHSLYKIRQDKLECWVLGSDPEAYETLLPAVLDSANRRTRCVASWQSLQQESRARLEDLLLTSAPLRAP